MAEHITEPSATSIAALTVMAAVALLVVGVGSAVAASNAGIGLTAAGAATPVPGDSMIGLTVFNAGATMNMPTGPGGAAVKFGTMA